MITWVSIWGFLEPFLKMAVILLVGHYLIVYFMRFISRAFEKSKLDLSLKKYCAKAITVALHIFVVLAALDSIGVSTSSMVAGLSSAVLAVGVALKDSLGNIAGGILLLFSPRFSTGDYIAAGGDEGTVISIELLHTNLLTPDRKQISIPNGTLANSHITNYSCENKRRVEIIFPISYDADVKKAKQLANKCIAKHPLVSTEPDQLFVRVKNFENGAINLTIRVWCKNEDYWTLYFDLIEDIRDVFAENGIFVLCKQVDVYVKSSPTAE